MSDTRTNVECRFCKRSYARRCYPTPKQRGHQQRNPLTGQWEWSNLGTRAWEAQINVKKGRAKWPCEPVLTWRGRRRYREEG